MLTHRRREALIWVTGSLREVIQVNVPDDPRPCVRLLERLRKILHGPKVEDMMLIAKSILKALVLALAILILFN